jgi:hypothetical protein
MKNRKRMAVLATLVLALVGTAAHAATVGSRFDATDYASLGVLTLTDGDSISFNTTTLAYSGTVGGLAFDGVGVYATSEAQDAGEGGNTSGVDGVTVQLAMYNFESINISSGVSITIDGNAGIALGSLGDMTIGSNINVNGSNGSQSISGQGGSGGEAGVAGASFDSAPPSNNNGDGGRHGGGLDKAVDGKGFGGGYAPSAITANNNGGAGGYGGNGGGDNLTIGGNGSGGTTYGDEELTLLFGGSGGAGSNAKSNLYDSSGAGGGGAIELTAVGTLTLSANLNANGGRGNMTTAGTGDKGSGSGSGGGILLNAEDIVITGVVSAYGGDGRISGTDSSAPGGGGGRIAIYAGNSLTIDGNDIGDGTLITDVNVDPSVNVNGGTRGSVASGEGTLFISVVPEPATMSLLALGGIAMLKRRKRA